MTADELRTQLDACHASAWDWALHVCRYDVETAGDVLQHAYLMILDGRAKFGGRSAFRTWLFGIIRRTAESHRRTQWRRRLLLHRHAGLVEVGESRPACDRVERDDEVRRLNSALARLSVRQRTVLELVFHHDMSIAEAATVMGVSLGTARTHYTRGKHQLAAHLGATTQEA